MQKTTVEVQYFKEKMSAVMRDIENRLKQLELVNQEREDHHDYAKNEGKTSPSHGTGPS